MGKFKKKVTDLQISRALISNEGKIGKVAAELGVTTGTIYNRMRQNPRIQAKFDDAEELLVDKAIQALHEKLDAGSLKAAQYVLDNRGGKRGYGAKQKELEKVEETNNLTFNILETSTMDIGMKKLLMESLKKEKAKQLEEGKNEE